jgi:adenine-specific DNA-methyltransferase
LLISPWKDSSRKFPSLKTPEAESSPMPKTIAPTGNTSSKNYKFPESTSPMRPDVGTQAQFNKHKPRRKYRYDDSLSPVMQWDEGNPAREQCEQLIRETLEAKTLEEARAAATKLKAMSKPFLNWSGKIERRSFEVPTLPLFIHERLSTKAILETLKGHRFDRNQETMLDLWGDPQHSITDQVLRAYEHKDKWINRMVLGDSLVVMNSLLHYESLGGQVQAIYIDPPYGVRFGSNFQPFVRKRDVSHNDDEDMTREPEMVQAYRDTWELGLHSYLTYLRDRLLLARELLNSTGSIFVQIGDENLHIVRCLMEEVFGSDNFVSEISFRKTGSAPSDFIPNIADHILWYAKSKEQMKYRPLFRDRTPLDAPSSSGADESSDIAAFQSVSLEAAGLRSGDLNEPFEWQGRTFRPRAGAHWKTGHQGLRKLGAKGRLLVSGNTLRYKMMHQDFPVTPHTNLWTDVMGAPNQTYVVQTNSRVVERCLLMSTDPGDLVLDPTCGSGTTAFVSEQWGRRWITIDTSRVPLALARQRLLTATFPWFQLQDESRGPIGGFVYRRRKNRKGEEVGGIVPHVTLKSIANDEPPQEEVVVNRPEEDSSITRVTGPFAVEATIPTPQNLNETKSEQVVQDPTSDGSFSVRMLEILRRSPVLRLEGNKTVTLKNVRALAKTLSLSAEALVLNGSEKPVSFLFGPENGAVSEKLVYEAAREAHAKNYTHLYVVGFAIEPNARVLIEKSSQVVGLQATYVQATPDLMMGDLLKNMRSSEIFSVCGLPDVELRRVKSKGNGQPKKFEVELLGLDVFDPIEMENYKRDGEDVPAWFVDTDYNSLCFHVSQAFFPRTGAWENLRRALRDEYEESVWKHLSGNISAPFEAGEHANVAIKVIDDRGNELMVVKNLSEAK